MQLDSGTLILASFLIEVPLLGASLLLLVLSRREAKSRYEAVDQITRTVKLLSAREYLESVLECLEDSTSSLRGIIQGGIWDVPEEKKSIETIASRLATLKGKRGKKWNVQCIMPLRPDRLGPGYEFEQAGSEVRLHPHIYVSGVRYIISDDRQIVIGMTEKEGIKEPVQRAFKVSCEALASLFEDDFRRKWSEGVTFDNYLRENVSDLRKQNPKATISFISTELRVPEKRLVNVLDSKPGF